MLRSSLPVLFLIACSNEPPAPPPDAPAADAELDAPTDAPADAPPHFAPCSEVCPGEALVHYYGPDNAYDYSYCTGSLRQCDDPTAPRCGGCPPP